VVSARPEAEGPLLPGLACSLALDVDDLPQCVPDLHQVGGIGHDPVDVFVGSGDLVQERVRVPRTGTGLVASAGKSTGRTTTIRLSSGRRCTGCSHDPQPR